MQLREGIVNVQRRNTDGRYEIWLQQYSYGGSEVSEIPGNDLITGKRKIRVSCEAKVVGGSHVLRFILIRNEDKKWIASQMKFIDRNA